MTEPRTPNPGDATADGPEGPPGATNDPPPTSAERTTAVPARASTLRLLRSGSVDAARSTVTGEAGEQGPAVSVWATAQTSPATQRKGRFTAESTAHPAKMLPAVAAHAIAHYTRPGDLVLDPMCGIGTTLVEALHAGRRAIGVEYEPHWVQVARANLDLARAAGIDHDARVLHGDARQLAALLPPAYLGQAALVVTSPPYGPSTHGQVSVVPGVSVQKYHHRYGNTLDRGNLANVGHNRLLFGFTTILAATARYLRPGGRIVITIRPWREHAELIDLPSQIIACGRQAGLIPVERCVALLARTTIDNTLVARGSFFQRDFIRKQRDAGLPLHLIAHEDVVVLAVPEKCWSSEKLKHLQREPRASQREPEVVRGPVWYADRWVPGESVGRAS
jgi:SAM-dependent methyltransferase